MLRPLSDFVVVKEETPEEYAAYKGYTHIIVPEKFEHGPEDRAVVGQVVAVGPHCVGMVTVGNRIVLGKWAGARIPYQGTTSLLVKEGDILAVLTDG